MPEELMLVVYENETHDVRVLALDAIGDGDFR